MVSGGADEKAIEAYYDRCATIYLHGWGSLEYYSGYVESFLGRALREGGRVLDVGCGPGQLTGGLPADIDVTGVDVSSAMLEQAREFRPDGRWVDHDFHEALPEALGVFDVVLVVGCLEFCRDLDRAMKNVADATVAGGRLLVGVLEDKSLPDGCTRRPFSEEGAPGSDMFSYGFEAQVAAIRGAGLVVNSYRHVPAWRHDEYGIVVHYGLWELTAPGSS